MLSAESSRRRVAGGRVAPGPGCARPIPQPFEYAATFAIDGRPGNIVQAAIAFGVDATFVATGISYAFEEERGQPMGVELTTTQPTFKPAEVRLGEIPVTALIQGFRITPAFVPLLFPAPPPGQTPRTEPALDGELPLDARDKFLQIVKPPEEISFLFSMVDTASGRELQDQPTLNLASLGSPDGKRPFRALARPLTFVPRSTLRMQIVERSTAVRGTLFVVLQGYKADPAAAAAPLPPLAAVPPGGRIIPFDYVSSLELTGRAGQVVTDEVPINTEGRFVVTSIGYGLEVASPRINPLRSVPVPNTTTETVPLANVPLRAFPTRTLLGGLRIKPSLVRVAIDGRGLNPSLPIGLLDQLFEPLNRSADVSFRYSFSDAGAGRDLQNQPIYNLAGLGSANGERPFKRLACPLTLLPRSTLRIQVEERFGQGRLFIVFQGHKLLAASNNGARR